MHIWYRMGLTVIAVFLLLVSVYAQDDETKKLVRFVEQGLKEGTLISAIEAHFAGRSQHATADPAEVVGMLNGLTARMYRAGAYRTGEALASQTLVYAEKNIGPDHPSTLSSINNLAVLYRSQGRMGRPNPCTNGP